VDNFLLFKNVDNIWKNCNIETLKSTFKYWIKFNVKILDNIGIELSFNVHFMTSKTLNQNQCQCQCRPLLSKGTIEFDITNKCSILLSVIMKLTRKLDVFQCNHSIIAHYKNRYNFYVVNYNLIQTINLNSFFICYCSHFVIVNCDRYWRVWQYLIFLKMILICSFYIDWDLASCPPQRASSSTIRYQSYMYSVPGTKTIFWAKMFFG